MIQESTGFYQKRLSLPQESIDRVELIIGLFEKLDTSFKPEKYFISDYLVGEEREWKHLYLFSNQKIWIAYKFLAVNEFEQVPIPSKEAFPIQLSVKSFDFVTYNDKSRFASTVQVEKFQLELKATQANCMVLLDILKTYFIQHLPS